MFFSKLIEGSSSSFTLIANVLKCVYQNIFNYKNEETMNNNNNGPSVLHLILHVELILLQEVERENNRHAMRTASH